MLSIVQIYVCVLCVFLCVFSAFVGGLKDVATHLQSDQVAAVSSCYLQFIFVYRYVLM